MASFRSPFQHSRETVEDVLSYDPSTGAFAWRYPRFGVDMNRSPGSINRAGDLLITVRGQTYPAKHLAWLLSYGHWPTHPVTLRSLATATTPEEKAAARLDLRLSNICMHAPARVPNSRADYMRDRRSRLRAQPASDTPRVVSGYPSIVWSRTDNLWVVREEADTVRKLRSFRETVEICRTPNTIDAIERFNEHNNRCHYVLDNPPVDLLPHEAAITTGKGHTLEELTRHMLYNPDTGDFLARTGNRAGMCLDRPKDPADPEGPRVVPYLDAIYYARNLAWFLHYYHWPAPREITYVDHTRRDDVSIANLTRSTKAPQDSAN